jgi:transcription initiation factor IIE alpha subunit
MDAEKYNRNVTLVCPTCGGTQFKYDKGVDETIEIAKCASCGRELTKDELIHENSENISEHVKEMGDEIIKDAAKEMKEALENAFKGSKNIRIK